MKEPRVQDHRRAGRAAAPPVLHHGHAESRMECATTEEDLLVEVLGSVCNDAVEDGGAAQLAPALPLKCCVDAESWQDDGHSDCQSPVLCYNPLRSKMASCLQEPETRSGWSATLAHEGDLSCPMDCPREKWS
jgi:hypothetical protein